MSIATRTPRACARRACRSSIEGCFAVPLEHLSAVDLLAEAIRPGATVAAAIGAVLDAGAVPDVTVVVSHALLVGPAAERLARLPIRRLVATDSVRLGTPAGLPVERVSLAPLLAEAVGRLHGNQS